MMSKLPKNWCECKLEDLGKIFGGYAFKSLNYTLDGARVVRITNVQKGHFEDETPKFYSIQNFLNDYLLQNDDILISLTGNVGRVCKIEQKYLPAYLNQRVEAFRINNKICAKFVYYLMQQQEFEKKCIENSKGVAQKNLSPEYIKKYVIFFPPLDEQKRIVEKIEELFSDIDNGIKDLKIVQAQIKQYRQSVLKSAFEGKLYKTSEWKEVKLEDVCQINPKTEIKDMKDDDIVSFLPMTSVKAECNYYTEENVLYSKVKKGYTKFKNRDVLFAKITPCMENGKVCIVDNLIQDIGFGSTEFHILRCLNNIIPKYVYYVVIQQCFRKKAKKNMVGAVGQQRVPADFMKNFDILLPPLPEQQQIVAEIEKRFAVADEMEKAVNDSLLQAEKLKQSILKQAFAGKLVPQNPNDEPAAVLLERIKTAKENSTKGKK
ncbi:MAG: restriction endonuclease subunit S [Azospirillum sp.]|nr:restriction endonuclease subunit S [Azospirillum sp.]